MKPLMRSFWHGGQLSPYERLSLQSFVDHGFLFDLYSYEEITVPAGICLKHADDVLPKDRIFFYRGAGNGSIAGFANLFRYALLRKQGGCWVDMDVVCLSSEFPDDGYLLGWESKETVGSAILGLPRDCDLLRQLWEAADAKGPDIQWGETGPYLLTELVRQSRLETSVRGPEQFYPIHFRDVCSLYHPDHAATVKDRVQYSTTIHLWNEVRRRLTFHKYVAPPEGSYLHRLFAKHAIRFSEPAEYSAEYIDRVHAIQMALRVY